uniref:Deoxyuridine 5'-triphosphate nucleotidohydrolase n=1 Tax=Amazona collaria TaxID=241587 RepID=A0A8B9GDD9_9PSIT
MKLFSRPRWCSKGAAGGGSARAAGYDLYSAYDCDIPPMGKAVVKTDIQVALPSGCYGRVAPRSGLAAKHFIDVGAGVIDEDYRGNVGVVLFNFGKETFEENLFSFYPFWIFSPTEISS